jgi:hypothetical protein
VSQNVDFGDAFTGARAAPRRAGRAAERADKTFLRGSFPALVLRNDPARIDDDLAPWSRTEVIEPCETAFLRVPARLHLGLGRFFDRFACARVERSGSVSSLNLSSHALGLYEVVAKRFLRRFNLDALPQLLNVISGEMSLVGPRPRALAHDQLFERRIALYARRHNVKPGITGWAPVNGLRGEVDTPAKIRRRIACDLQYIDNWSLTLDIRILFLTVFSRKAYRNAV